MPTKKPKRRASSGGKRRAKACDRCGKRLLVGIFPVGDPREDIDFARHYESAMCKVHTERRRREAMGWRRVGQAWRLLNAVPELPRESGPVGPNYVVTGPGKPNVISGVWVPAWVLYLAAAMPTRGGAPVARWLLNEPVDTRRAFVACWELSGDEAVLEFLIHHLPKKRDR